MHSAGPVSYVKGFMTQDFENLPPQEILAWAASAYRGRLALACSFGGPSGSVLVDMIAKIDEHVPVYYLNTGLLFAETLDLVERVRERYGITARAVKPELSLEAQEDRYGSALWERDPDQCCKLRKVEPQRDYLRGFDAWISGIRRDQGETRKDVPVMGPDKFGRTKINPLAAWTEEMVWAYIEKHDVPYNVLLKRGYRSIGCTVCTVPIAQHDRLRAGRWKGFNKLECGLHV
jgi:phosphoadenosine phosphosulfate reductase